MIFINTLKLFNKSSNLRNFNYICSVSWLQSKKMSSLRTVAIGQMRATSDKTTNRKLVQEIVETSVAKNAKFIFLPECCDFVGKDKNETLALSEKITGPTIQFYRSLAKEKNIWLSIGGFHELNEEGSEKIFNSHLIINDSGELFAKYQKIHMFDVNTPEFKFRESHLVSAGKNIVPPQTTPIGQLGLMICYDVRFPELSTILRKQGAEILTYPSAFAFTTGEAHWEILLRARAIENQCYVIAAAQIGYHNAKRRSYGHAMVVDPWGKILAECDPEKELDVATAEIDVENIQSVRRNMPCLEHRRSDIYSLAALKLKRNDFTSNFMFQSFPIPEETIFYESEHSLAFCNIRCVVIGHVLVASRRQVPRLQDLNSDEITDFFQTVCKIQKLTEAFYGTDASTITIQDGELAGQTVRHVHCHIMPRREGDFAENDDIYVELANHDKGDKAKIIRPNEEMKKEAVKYRKLLHKL